MVRYIVRAPQAQANYLVKITSAAILIAAVVGVSSAANAAIIHGDFSDIPPGAVMYLDVTESSFSHPIPPGPPLYGAPSITSNTLDFTPSAFGTSSVDGASGLIDGQLNFTVMTLPGAGITGFSIVEGGDFSFSGLTPHPGTFVSASAAATISILEVDGVALASPISVFASDLFVTDYPTTGGAPTTPLLPWSLVTFVDLGSVLPFGYEEGATKFEVAINNLLRATTTGPGYEATIAKKDFKIIPVGDLTPDAVPEPASLALAGLAILFGMAIRKRR